ncbi:MAG: NADH-quinone oxidoreductase subunit N, partial [Candidatus Methylomirabilales bacterium]
MLPFGLADLQAALPEIFLSVWALLVLSLDFIFLKGRRAWLAYGSLLGIIATFLVLLSQIGVSRTAWSGFYILDAFALFFKVVFLGATAFVILMAIGYLEVERIDRGEFYALLLFSTVGMMLMASSGDLLTLYLGLETMSVSIYALIGFLKKERRSAEAALKYLLMGVFSSGVLLYGIVFLYGLSGTTNLQGIGKAVGALPLRDPVATLAMAMLAAGFGFKIAAVPFHMWVPDTYEAASTPFVAWLSVAPKAAGFAVVFRVFIEG